MIFRMNLGYTGGVRVKNHGFSFLMLLWNKQLKTEEKVRGKLKNMACRFDMKNGKNSRGGLFAIG